MTSPELGRAIELGEVAVGELTRDEFRRSGYFRVATGILQLKRKMKAEGETPRLPPSSFIL